MSESSHGSGEVKELGLAEVQLSDLGLDGPETVERPTNVFGGTGKATEYFAKTEFWKGQRETIERIESSFEQGYRVVVVRAPTGSGKAQPLTAKVLTPTGFTTMGDLSVGDSVIGGEGVPVRVIGVYPQGKVPVYRVRFHDGGETECCGDHLWKVKTNEDANAGRAWSVIPLKEFGRLKLSKNRRKYRIPVVSPVMFSSDTHLPLSPYVLGVLLGDGTLKGTPKITTSSEEVKNRVSFELPEGCSISDHGYRNGAFHLSIVDESSTRKRRNRVTHRLDELGLWGSPAWGKFIPDEYQLSSFTDRLALLQGLIDSDGSADVSQYVYTTSSLQLADDVSFVAMSLGCIVSRCVKEFPVYAHNGNSKIGRASYSVRIVPPDNLSICTRLDRMDRFKGRRNGEFARYVDAVDYIGDVEARCILVNSESQTYVTDDFIVTHNSQIARAFAFQSNNAYVITPQKILQDQYANSFPDMHVIKGRTAYEAAYQTTLELYLSGSSEYDGPTVTCADCVCNKLKGVDDDVCPYKQAKMQGYREPVVVHNFDSFFYQNMRNPWPRRKLLIVDEAHAIENKLMGFVGFKISNRFMQELEIPEYDDPRDYDDLCERWMHRYIREIEDLESLKSTHGLSPQQVTLLNTYQRLVSKLSVYLQERKKDHPTEYVIDYENHGQYQSIEFRPVTVHAFTYQNLFDYGQRVLLMSASIDELEFPRIVGLKPDEVAFVDVPSTFPIKNNKIVRRYAGKMTFNCIQKTLPKLVSEIEAILEQYPSKKGIIQTHTERIANYIREHMQQEPRLTFNKDFQSPADMLEEHRRKPGSFIVASGLREGISLDGDLSQIQILCKVPYPSMGDRQVARRMEIDKLWYGYITAQSFTQIVGRSIRSERDKAITFILDEGFIKFWNMNKRFLPPHIREAVTNG